MSAMRRISRFLLPLLPTLALAAAASAQTVAISPTIQDSDSQTWNSGTYKIVLKQSQPGTPYRSDTGASFTTSFSGTMNSSGVLSVTLTDTNFIVPANSQWTFTICPLTTGAACATVTTPVTAANASQIQTILNAAVVAPRITGGPFTQAYNDTEVAQLPNNSYYSLTALQNRCYSNTWGACSSSASAGVSSLNSLTGALTLAAGSNITITPSGGNTLTIASSGGSNPGGTTGQVQWNNGGVLAGFTMVGDATLNTSTGSLTLASVNSAIGTCGDATHIPQVTLNAKGLTTACTPIAILSGPSFGTITSGTNTTASMVVGSGATLGVTGSGTIAATSLTPDPFTQGSLTFGFAAGTISATTFSGAFSGDCSSCTNINASDIASGTLAIARGGTGNGTAPSSGQIEVAQSGTVYNPKSLSGDATLAATGALTLATVNSNTGTCGDATHVGQVTLNAKGLTTACTAVAITALTNPMTTLGDIIYGGAAGAATRLAGPTVGTVPYTLTSTPSGGAATAPAWGLPGVPGRTVTTTSDTIAATDRSNVIGFTSASAVAEAFTSPATLGNNFSVGLHNLAAGAVTATLGAGNFATTGTSTKVLANGEWCAMSSSDNTNIDDRCSSGLITTDATLTPTHTAPGVQIALATGHANTWTGTQTLTGHIIMSAHDVAIPLVCADSSASGTAQSCTTSPSFTPAAGDAIIYTTTTANTGTGLTLNVNGLGAKSVAKWQGGTTLVANDVLANKYVLATYDGTNWELSTIGNAPSGGGGGALSAITAATGSNTIASGNNAAQIWNWALTANSETAFTFGETTAATSGTLGNQYILKASTLAGSTAVPLNVSDSLSGSQTLPALHITPTWNTTGVVDAGILENVTNTASGTGSKLIDLQVGGTTEFNVDKAGNSTQSGSLTTGSATCTSFGTAGGLCAAEGTSATNVAAASNLYPDSTAHEWKAATNGSTSYGLMVRAQPGSINTTGLTAAVTTATLCAASAGACNASGQYHVHMDVWGSGTACSSVTAGGVTPSLTWTDGNGTAHSAVVVPFLSQTTATAVALTSTAPTVPAQTALANEGGSADFNITTNGSVIQYAVAYTACTTGTLTYNISAAVTRVQ